MVEPPLELEIAYILFIDIVAYSTHSIRGQRECMEQLNGVVRASETFRMAKEMDKLIALPTGDGVALVFLTTPDAPAQCALEISRGIMAMRKPGEWNPFPFAARMGLHDGPVTRIVDINDRNNVAGAGINEAQRVMDCGDKDHILLSKHIAQLLVHYSHLDVRMSDLGECEVKHGVRLSVVNLYTDELGNRDLPDKFAILLFNSLSLYERSLVAEINRSLSPATRGLTEGQLRVSLPPDADIAAVLANLKSVGVIERTENEMFWTLSRKGFQIAKVAKLPNLWGDVSG